MDVKSFLDSNQFSTKEEMLNNLTDIREDFCKMTKQELIEILIKTYDTLWKHEVILDYQFSSLRQDIVDSMIDRYVESQKRLARIFHISNGM